MVQDRDVRRRHVREVLEQPEREHRFRPRLREPADVQRAILADAPQDRRDQLADVDRRDPRPHADPEPRRIQLGSIPAGVLDGHRRRADGELHGAAHQLQVLLVLAQIRQHIEVPHLARDLDAQSGGVEAPDVVHAGPSLEGRLAELPTADPVRRDNADSCDHHAVHCFPHALFVATSLVVGGLFPGSSSCSSLTPAPFDTRLVDRRVP